MGLFIIQTDIIRYYLLPNITAIKPYIEYNCINIYNMCAYFIGQVG